MAPYRCFEERADSDLVPEMDELSAGIDLFGVDRFGHLFLGGHRFPERIGKRQTGAVARDGCGGLLFEKHDPFRYCRHRGHQSDGVVSLMFLPSYFHYSVDILLFLAYDECIKEGEAVIMQTITQATATNQKGWQSRIA